MCVPESVKVHPDFNTLHRVKDTWIILVPLNGHSMLASYQEVMFFFLFFNRATNNRTIIFISRSKKNNRTIMLPHWYESIED
jgi:hypothetical protein